MKDAWKRLGSTARQYVGTAAGKRKALIAAAVAGVMFMTAGGALAMRAATHQFAEATMAKLGGDDPKAVLDAIADRVVKQLMSANGPIGAAGRSITDKFDSDSLIDQVTNGVVQAGMGKINGISTDAIVEQVTNALVQKAMAKIEGLDVQALAKSTLDGAVQDLLASVDLDKIIREELAKIDVEAIVTKVVQKQMGSSGGGLLGMLLR